MLATIAATTKVFTAATTVSPSEDEASTVREFVVKCSETDPDLSAKSTPMILPKPIWSRKPFIGESTSFCLTRRKKIVKRTTLAFQLVGRNQITLAEFLKYIGWDDHPSLDGKTRAHIGRRGIPDAARSPDKLDGRRLYWIQRPNLMDHPFWGIDDWPLLTILGLVEEVILYGHIYDPF